MDFGDRREEIPWFISSVAYRGARLENKKVGWNEETGFGCTRRFYGCSFTSCILRLVRGCTGLLRALISAKAVATIATQLELAFSSPGTASASFRMNNPLSLRNGCFPFTEGLPRSPPVPISRYLFPSFKAFSLRETARNKRVSSRAITRAFRRRDYARLTTAFPPQKLLLMASRHLDSNLFYSVRWLGGTV